jgi:Flp pilus assembly pilin Flp
MIRLIGLARRLVRDERGASIIEYALMFALITIVCIGAMGVLGAKINEFFSSFASTI